MVAFSLAIDYAQPFLTFPLRIATWAGYLILLTWFAVICHRLVLIGPKASTAILALPPITGREARFLGWMIGVWIVAVGAVVVGGTVILNLLPARLVESILVASGAILFRIQQPIFSHASA